jgi:hypothetical protein
MVVVRDAVLPWGFSQARVVLEGRRREERIERPMRRRSCREE